MRYLERICKGIHPQEGIEFEWYTGREVSFLYMKTAGSIVKDIAENRYPDGHLLNLEQLSERYAVSLRTIRRTIKFLNDLQLVETRETDWAAALYILHSRRYPLSSRNSCIPCWIITLCMLELTELLAKATLSVCMERCTWKELEGLAKEIQEKKRLSPESVLFIIKHHENPCICNIAEQLEEAVSGSMLIRTLFGHEADEQTQQDMKSLCQTLRNREPTQGDTAYAVPAAIMKRADWKMKRC